jgi:hypothetical protein
MRILLALIAAAIVTTSGVAYACSCVAYNSAAEHAAQVDVVFIGRVVGTQPARANELLTTFEVIEPLKLPSGFGERHVQIYHSSAGDASCGISFEPNAELIVAAYIDRDDNLGTNSCTAPRWPAEDYRRALAPE